MDQERMNEQKKVAGGLPPKYPKRLSTATTYETPRPLSMLSTTAIPLAPSSYKVWDKSNCTSNDVNSTATNHAKASSSSKGKRARSTCPSVGQQSEAPLPPFTFGQNDNGKGKSPMNPSPQPAGKSRNIPGKAPAGNNTGKATKQKTNAQNSSGGRDPKVENENVDSRTLSNRLSAKKCRTRKFEYIKELEKKTQILGTQLDVLRPRVETEKKRKECLLTEHQNLNQRIIDCAKEEIEVDEEIEIDAQIEENTKEVARLRQLYLSQQQERMQQQQQWNAQPAVWGNGFEGVMNPGLNQPGWPKQMIYPNQMQGNQQLTINEPALNNGGVGGQAYYGHHELHNNHPGQMQNMAVDWNQPGMQQMPNALDTTIPNLDHEITDQILDLDEIPSHFFSWTN